MPTLLETQRELRGLLAGGAAGSADGAGSRLATGIAGIAGDDPAPLLAIYRNTVTSALVNALGISFPAVRLLVGAEFFEGAARQFITAQLPTSAYLNDYGAKFPDFLRAFAPAAGLPYLGDVARLEWAFSRALHAGDVPPLNLALLAELDEDATESLCFVAHPAVSLLRLNTPADAIWSAVLAQDEAAMRAIDMHAGETYLIVDRGADGAQVRRLQPSAWHFTERLCRGLPLRDALAPGAESPPDFEVSQALLADHLVSGRLTGFVRS